MSDNMLYTASLSVKLSDLEKSSVKDSVLRFCVANPATRMLRTEEKSDIRVDLLTFMSSNAQQNFAFAREDDRPMSLWFGANLFGRLQPFAV